MAEDTKLWLIKKDSQIRGPFSEQKIKQMLKEGEFSAMDLACLPDMQVWLNICCYDQFMSEQQKTSRKKSAKEEEKTLASTATVLISKTKKKIKQLTDTLSVSNSETETDMISQTETNTKPVVVKDVSYEVLSKNKAGAKAGGKPQRIKKIFKFLIYMSAVSVIAYLIFSDLVKNNNMAKNTLASPESKKAHLHFKAGDYIKALESWKSVENTLSDKDKVWFYILQLKINNHIYQGEKSLQLLERTGLYPEMKDMVSALLKIKSEDFYLAKQILNSIIEQKTADPKIQRSAVINLILLFSRDQNCDEAWSYYEQYKKLIKKSFMLNTVLSSCFLRSKNFQQYSSRTAVLLSSVIEQKREYYQEAQMASAYQRLLKGQSDKIEPIVQKILESGFYSSENYYRSVFVDAHIYSWPQWLGICRDLYKSQKNHPLFVSLYAYCLFRSGQKSSAFSEIEKAIAMNSKDSLIKSVHAYMAYNSQLQDQFELILEDAVQLNKGFNYALADVLQAQVYALEKNWSKVFKQWEKVLKNQEGYRLFALTGMGRASYELHKLQEARRYLKQAGLLDPEYSYTALRLLKLKLKN